MKFILYIFILLLTTLSPDELYDLALSHVGEQADYQVISAFSEKTNGQDNRLGELFSLHREEKYENRKWLVTGELPLWIASDGAMGEAKVLKPLSTATSEIITEGVIQKGVAEVAVDGLGETSIWTSTSNRTSVENAFKHWLDHSSEFPEFINAKQYVEGTNKFLKNPPPGTLTKIRPSNGDILKYHPDTNTFGVMDSSGIPRTMFRPKDGMKYWIEQR